jgi:hypothetical protein
MPTGQLERGCGGAPLGCRPDFLFDGCLVSMPFRRTP